MKFRMPHIFAVLFLGIIVAAIATWIVPAGEYQRAEGIGGRLMVVPETYQVIDSNPTNLMEILSAVPRGLIDAAGVVFAVFIVGGTFGVLYATNTIVVGLNWFTKIFKDRELIMIPIIMVAFSLLASMIGMPELCLVYIPVIISLCHKVKWDSMAAVGITLIGVTAGFGTALFNPFSVGISQQLAELPLGSGVGYRLVALAVILTSGILYTLRYVRKVSKNPELSLSREVDEQYQEEQTTETLDVSQRHIWTGIVLFGGIALLVYGILVYGWGMLQLSAIFMGIIVVVGAINRMSLDTISKEFINGCQGVLVGALVVGFARAIALVLDDGQIMDTIIFALVSLVEGLPPSITAAGMLIVQTGINFVVPSSSGQAIIAMPIMIPLADLVGVTRQTAILAYQLGDGLSNILFPTSGYFMATLAMASISYQKWLHFFLPLMGIWLVLGMILLIIAQLFGWQ